MPFGSTIHTRQQALTNRVSRSMRHCLFVVGTRAQLIKLAPVLQQAATKGLPHSAWLAGQHAESISDLIDDFELATEIVQAEDVRERSSIGKLVTWVPKAASQCYRRIKQIGLNTASTPLVIVHGDTLSALIGAYAGRWAGAEIVHIESGLSSNRLFDPFPEEVTRRLVFHVARYALCPNDDATARMRRYTRCEAINTHENTLLDCVRFAVSRSGTIESDRMNHEYFVASIHRFQNIYRTSTLKSIVDQLISVAEFGPMRFIVHPATEERLKHDGLWRRLIRTPNMELQNRMRYTSFLALLAGARAVFTDGGSNQEELSYLGVPTVLFRTRTERPDGLGANIVFRHQLDSALESCVASGRIDALRQPHKLHDNIYPSAACVRLIEKWAVIDSAGEQSHD